MSVIKSYSVGNGDSFYIEHGSDNFTIIDCCLDEDNRESIVNELSSLSKKKGIIRFISTHPDDDHIRGLEFLDDKIEILNFYVVKNNVIKADQTDSFDRYCALRDHATKAFYISKGCARRWMNQDDATRRSSGISIRWPDPENEYFKAALADAEDGESPNNMSAVIHYSLTGGVNALWMGDLDTDFMEEIEDELDVSSVDILFAPHHGRISGKVPDSMLARMSPKMIVIGEAPSEDLHYYDGYNTITQNSAGDILFECEEKKVHVYTANDYDVDFLDNEWRTRANFHYVGTLNLD